MTNKNEFMFNKVKIDGLRYKDILKTIDRNIENKGYLCLAEASGIMRSQKDRKLFEAMANSLITIPDGMPLEWFGKLVGAANTERISGVELLKRMLEDTGKYKHFLLGDTNKTIERIINKAAKTNPQLNISGYSPPFKNEFDKDDNEEMLKRINSANPDLIWVSFGLGKQEKWMFQNYNKLDKGIMIGVGAAFRYYIGEIVVPHIVIQKLGLQWVTRLMEQPKSWIKGPLIARINFVSIFFIELIKAKKQNNQIQSKDTET